MSRYLLDTNILIFMLGDTDSISKETVFILNDYDNQLFTSSINLIELIQLFNIGKIKPKKFKSTTELYEAIENTLFVKILPFSKNHTLTLSRLNIAKDHNDPFDHSIVAQAITEDLVLVSSDKKFQNYTTQNLKFAFNKR